MSAMGCLHESPPAAANRESTLVFVVASSSNCTDFGIIDLSRGKGYVLLKNPTTSVIANYAARLLQQSVPMPSNPTKKPLSEPKELEDQLRQRAYELYEERGREDGHD